MKKLKGKKKIFGLVALLVILGILGYFLKNRDIVMDVEAYEVARGSIESYVEEIGTVKVSQNETVFANLTGRVTEVLFDLGDEVKKGQVLVRLDSEDRGRDIQLLKAQKDALRAGYNQSMEPIDEAEVKKMELAILNMEKTLEKAARDLENQRLLLDSGLISNDQFQDFTLQYSLQETELEGLRLDLDLLKKPISDTVTQQYEANLSQLNLQIEALESKKGDFVYTAPFDGTILAKNILEGSYVQQGSSIFEIGNLRDLYIESDLLMGDIGDVFEGDLVKIENSDLGLSNLMGKVTKIHPQAFSKVSDLGVEQKRIRVEISIEEPSSMIKPGYDLDVKIITEAKENVVLIPENALFELEGKDFLFVIEEGIATLRAVEIGIESERQVEIISGLQEGEMIILSPDEDLAEGMEVG